jgi:hypothetical protein
VKRLILILAAMALALPSVAQDKSPIRLPVVALPTPQPMPIGGDVAIPLDAWYVVESDVELLVFTSPGGSIKITRETGPIKLLGKFVGEEAKGVQSKKYDSKHLVLITADKPGRDELLLVPVGAKAESEAKRVFLRVGTMPQPPPEVDPKPDVKPDPKPIKVDSFRVLFIIESANTPTAKQQSTIYGQAVRTWLDANTTPTGNIKGWLTLDKDTSLDKFEVPPMQRLWSAIQPKVKNVPCVAIEVNGVATLENLPESPDEMLKLLKKYRGE